MRRLRGKFGRGVGDEEGERSERQRNDGRPAVDLLQAQAQPGLERPDAEGRNTVADLVERDQSQRSCKRKTVELVGLGC